VEDQNLDALTLNDALVETAADGTFSTSVSLLIGERKTILLAARDRAGNEADPVLLLATRPKPREPWEVALGAAVSAGLAGDWKAAAQRLTETEAAAAPAGRIPDWLIAGVATWRAAPQLTIHRPDRGARIESTVVRVEGQVRTGRTSDRVFVQEIEATTDEEGRFGVDVPAGPVGIQEIRVEVRDGELVRRSVPLYVSIAEALPAWAKPGEEQRTEARRIDLPVAFENDLGMGFLLVPAGTFAMGSPRAETGRLDDEAQHPVVLSRPFYVQATEVTNGQFRAWRAEHKSGRFGGVSLEADHLPAVRVGHEEARGFAAWLSERDGRDYRLPTEAEWEYAARAGAVSRFVWGDDETQAAKFANTGDRTLSEAFSAWPLPIFDVSDGHATGAQVGSYAPNAWGLYDMAGNAWEWCADWYARYESAAARDPKGAAEGTERVIRGGSWTDEPASLRVAYRYHAAPDLEADNVGFRLVVPVEREDK
jgi:formylglycine-generating enzyme required for sulfatase activity